MPWHRPESKRLRNLDRRLGGPSLRLARSNLLNLLAEGMTALGWFLSLTLLARHYPAREFGGLAVSRAIIAFAAGLSAFGLNTVGLIDVASGVFPINPLPIVWRQGLMGALSAGGLLIISQTFPPELRTLTLVQVPSVLLTAITLDWVAQGIQRFGYVLAARTAASLLVVGSAVAVVVLDAPITYFAWSISGASAAIAVCLGMLLSRSHCLKSRGSAVNASFKRGFAAWLPGLAAQGYYNADRIMMGGLAGLTLAGEYEVASRVFQAATLPSSATSTVFLSSFSKGDISRQLKAGGMYAHWIKLQSLIAIALVGFGPILLPTLVPLVFGATYDNAVLPSYILLDAAALVWLGAPFAMPLLALNRPRALLKATTWAFALNIVLNLGLIPVLGPTGAALANVITEMVAIYLTRRAFEEATQTSFRKVGRRILELQSLCACGSISILHVSHVLHELSLIGVVAMSIITLLLLGLRRG